MSLIPGSQLRSWTAQLGLHPSLLTPPTPAQGFFSGTREDSSMVQCLQGQERHSGNMSLGGSLRGRSSRWQIRGQGKVRKYPNFDTHSSHNHTCPRKRRKRLAFWHSSGAIQAQV